jgi:hypothetical protein
MANPVKIYEVRTLGYNQLMQELSNIDKAFQNIAVHKKELNKQKLDTKDADTLRQINNELRQQKIRTAELRLEKQQLLNEAKVIQVVRQAELNQQKAILAGITAEAGSIAKLVEQRKLLRTAIEASKPGNNVFFGNQNIPYDQAVRQFQELNTQITKYKTNLTGVQDLGTRMTTALSDGFARMKGQLGQLILTQIGWFAAFYEASKLVKENIELSDSYADLQIRIKGTKEDVEKLVDSLRKIDTRTSLKGLVDLAAIVAKKGVNPADIADLTKEFDKLNVVLGKELGEPATATANIIKLITVFNEDRHVTAERINEIATSMFKLTTSGVSTGEFLVNFAERVGAVRGITGITLPNVLALGAALQQLGQRVELSSTALVQLTTRIFTDVPKFATAAGKTIEEFRRTLKDNPFEALVQVAEGLKDADFDEIGSEFEEVVTAFQEVGVTGVRIKAVLGDIATNAEFVRERMHTAAVTTADYARINEAAALKQNTLAATVDRARKAFELLGTQKSVQVFLTAIATLILLLVNNLGIIITTLAIYASLWVIANSAMIGARVGTILLNAALTASNAILVIQNVFIRAYTASLGLFTGATRSATAATTLLGIAMKLLPLGAIIALIALLAAGCSRLKSQVDGSTEALRRQAERMRIQQEITDRANESIGSQIAELEALVRAIESTNTSYDTKRILLEKLIGKNELFSKVLKDNVIDLVELRKALESVKGQIELNARAEAAASIAGERYKDYLNVVSVRHIFETESVTGKIDLSKEKFPSGPLRDIAFQVLGTPLKYGKLNQKDIEAGYVEIYGNGYKLQTILKNLTTLEKETLRVYNAYNEASTNIQVDLASHEAKRKELTLKTSSELLNTRIAEANQRELSKKELEAIIKDISAELDLVKEGSPRLKELQDARDKFQKRLDEITGRKKSTRKYTGAKLTGVEKDELNILDAQMKEELAIEQERFTQLQINHKETFNEEIQHVNNLAAINEKYLQKKADYLKAQGSLNAKEKEQLASFNKEIADNELKRLNDIQAIKDKEFSYRRLNLKAELEQGIAEIEIRQKELETDASITFVDKAQARLNADNAILKLQEKFNSDIDTLEKKLNQRSRENAKEGANAIKKTKEDIIKDTAAILNAQFKDTQDANSILQSEFKQRAADRTRELLLSNKSAQDIARGLLEIQQQLSHDLLAVEVALLKTELELYEKGRRDKLKSEKEYQEALAKYKEKEAQLVSETTQKELTDLDKFVRALKGFVSSFGEVVLGIKRYAKDSKGEAEKEADAIREAQNTIRQAIEEAKDAFFQAEIDKAQRRRDSLIEILENHQAERTARAQSQAEINSIDRQAAAEKKRIDKELGEEKKKIALKQLAIDFAQSIILALAQYGLPLAFIPIAAQTALYFVQRANIQAQTFAKGGIAPTKTGGEVVGPSHAQGGVKFNYEAQDKELMIINDKSAQDNSIYTLTGTVKQVASKLNELGGGIAFSSGASAFKRFDQGGLLGVRYSAPVFKPSTFNANNSDQLIQEVKGLIEAVNARIDRLQVVQVIDTVEDALNKKVKQTSIGILP